MDVEPTLDLSVQKEGKSFWQAYGFILIAVIFAIIVGVALVYAIGSIREEFTTPQTSTSQGDLYSDWKTYHNEEYGFEFKYPTSSSLSVEAGDLVFREDFLSPRGLIMLKIESTSFNDIQDWFNDNYKDRTPIMVPETDFVKAGGVVGLHIHDDPIGLGGSCEGSIVFLKNKFVFKLFPYSYCESSTLQKTMISSFKFIEPQTAETEPLPVINSISPQSGKIGTIVTLKGTNLNGFEGDLDAWIENESGEVAYLGQYGKSVYPETNQITAQITEKVCKTNESSYSGDPCKEYMTVVPGIYKIYTRPLGGVASNKVLFVVTE